MGLRRKLNQIIMKKLFCFLLVLMSGLTFAQIPTTGLIGYWPFSNNATDQSGQGNHGTVSGATLTTDRFGACNKAYLFDGVDDYIDFGTSTIFKTNNFSISLWYNQTTYTTASVLIAKSTGAQMGYRMTIDNDYNWFIISQMGIPGFCPLQSSTTTPLGVWHHIVCMYNGTTMTTYLDNVQVASISCSQTINTDNPLRVGALSQTLSSFFNGKIDDIRFYDHVLSAGDIAALYNESCNIPSPTAIGDSVCEGETATLTAAGGTAYYWYPDMTSCTPLFIGNPYVTSALTISDTFYVANNAGSCESPRVLVIAKVNLPPLPPTGITNYSYCVGDTPSQLTAAGTNLLWYTVSTGGTGSPSAPNPSASVPGVTHYYVSQSAGGCEGPRLDITVTVNALPFVSINAIPVFINYFASPLSLTGNPSGGSFSGDGVWTNTLYPDSAGLGTTIINYNYTDVNNCSNSSSVTAIIYDTLGVVCTSFDTVTTYISVTDTLIINTTLTGVAPPNNINTLKVYPNPASDHLYIDCGDFSTMNGYTIRIENSLSQVVFTSLVSQQLYFIDLNTWSGNALYHLYVIDNLGTTIETKKIILQ